MFFSNLSSGSEIKSQSKITEESSLDEKYFRLPSAQVQGRCLILPGAQEAAVRAHLNCEGCH